MKGRVAVFGLVLMAVVITGGIIMASTASATTLCKVSVASCTVIESYPAKTAVKASLQEGTVATFLVEILGTLHNVDCSSASLEGETTATSGEPLPLKTTALSFGECKEKELSGEACTASTLALPTKTTIKLTSAPNGSLAFEGTELLLNCKVLHCVYRMPTLEVQGGSPAKLVASKAELTKVSGFLCPTKAFLDATYTVGAPKPAYVEK